MTVARKLALLPVLSLSGILVLAAVLLHDIGSVYDAANYANDNTVPSLVVLQKLDSNFVGERLNVWQHVATPDAAGMAAAEKQMAARRAKVAEALDDYQKLVSDDHDREMLAADKAAIEYYDTVRDKVLALSSAGHKAEAIQILMSLKAELAKAADALTQHLLYNSELGKTHGAAAAQIRGRSIWMGLLWTALVAALIIVVGVTIHKQLMAQLGGEPDAVAAVATQVAKGDFSSRIDLQPGDTSSLFAAVARMQGDLKQRTEEAAARLAEERSRMQAEQAAAVENARIRTALDRVAAAVMLVDTEGKIIYVNDFALGMFRNRAADIRSRIAKFEAERILGAPFDLIYSGAARGNRIAALAAAHSEEITLGNATLRFICTPVVDGRGSRVGTVVQWTDRTDEIVAEREVADMVSQALAGDLTVRISEAGKEGFFKILADGMNRLLSNVAVVIRTMGQAAMEVRNGAGEISRGNLDLSQRTEQQASSLEETAASMEEMTSMVKSNADNAAQANQLAAAARQQAERGGKVVGSAVIAMNEINAASKRIADIIGVIDDIAFQTNLLALNAAVEAARAGDQGRGFAVVASEVRNLASRSAGAAKEIKGLIQDSVAKVSDGARLVDESGRVLGDIVTGVQKVTDVMAEIAASSMEQASGIEQVNKAVTSMDSATQQNAALVEQASAAAHTLNDQAATLMELIAKYRVDAPAGQPSSRPHTALVA